MEKEQNSKFDDYLCPTEFIDSDSAEVIEFTHTTIGAATSPIDKSIKLYYKIRDHIHYSPYDIVFERKRLKASWALTTRVGFCIPKAILLAATARVVGIPSRLRVADVRNHLASEKLLNLIKTDVFYFHGYTELFLDDKWVKVTPAFNRSLCEKFNVLPLEFDGKNDSIFQAFDKSGNKLMEYILDRGHFSDLPYEEMVRVFKEGYPHLTEQHANIAESE